MKMEQSVPKRRHIKFRRRESPKRKHTTFRTRRMFEIKKLKYSWIVEGVEATACRIGSESDKHPKHFDVVKEMLKGEQYDSEKSFHNESDTWSRNVACQEADSCLGYWACRSNQEAICQSGHSIEPCLFFLSLYILIQILKAALRDSLHHCHIRVQLQKM